MIKRNYKRIAGFVGVLLMISIPVILFAAIVPDGSAPGDYGFEQLGQMLVNIINWLLVVGFTISATGFAAEGIMYLTAGGDPGKIGRSHVVFKKILVGFILAVSSHAIVNFIATSLGMKSDSSIVELYNSFIQKND